ncbi:hypothetical protein [Pleurochrysis sp. endemic virus unk]|nr:hypothetical protein [Pleurochrysis sp. endemic virus unk]
MSDDRSVDSSARQIFGGYASRRKMCILQYRNEFLMTMVLIPPTYHCQRATHN